MPAEASPPDRSWTGIYLDKRAKADLKVLAIEHDISMAALVEAALLATILGDPPDPDRLAEVLDRARDLHQISRLRQGRRPGT